MNSTANLPVCRPFVSRRILSARVCCLVVAAAALLVSPSASVQAAEAAAEANNADAPSRPNILFAIADDWSYGHASAYGCQWVETPNFDRVAREGILFNNAYTPNAKCAPSRATILTGRYSWQLEEAGNHMAIFPPKFGGFMERLADAGYLAGYTGKGWGPGFANDADGKPRKITGVRYSKQTAIPPTKAISNNDYSANFADFLNDVPGETPWVFWYGTTEPHRRYEFKSGVRLGKKLSDIDRVPAYWPDNETVRHDMLDYAVEVEHYDSHLGRILEMLEESGQLDNTLIVCTSDHGMPFPRVKGQAYVHSNRVPLAVRWPQGIEGSGRTVSDFVNFTDLAPTFLEVAKVKDPGPIMQPTSGQSLTDIFESDASGQVVKERNHVLVGKERHDIGRPNNGGYPIRGINNGEFLLLQNFETERWPGGHPVTGYLNCDGSPTKTNVLELMRSGEEPKWWQLCFGQRPQFELYNLSVDDDCSVNVADAERYAEVLKELKLQMESELKAQGDPRMFGQGEVFDNYPYSGASTDNFYERFTSGEGKKPKAGWVSPTDFEASLEELPKSQGTRDGSR
ncbi:MAG: sulfatase [Pirellulaceae bacterium]